MFLIVRSGGETGKRVEVTSNRLVIGRDPGCDLTIDDSEASRRHAYLELRPDGKAEVGDLGSKNGTFVNGHRLSGPVLLSGGEEVKVGNTVFAVEAEAPAPGPVAAAAAPGATEVATPKTPPVPAGPAPAPGQSEPTPRQESALRRVASRVGSSTMQRLRLENSVRQVRIIAGVAVIVAALAIVVGVLALLGVFSSDPEPPPTPDQIVEQATPSTVFVLNPAGQSSGSGWVLDAAEGLVVTNAHVVAGGDQFEVGTQDNLHPAEIVGVAPCDDLAVLRVDDATGLTTIPLGSQSALELGQTVIVLGYPGNASLEDELQSTVGTVSAVETAIDDPAFSGGDPDFQVYKNVTQIDAAINHGNSGGPLINLDGEVVGVNTITSAGGPVPAQNQDYAIGADLIREDTDVLRTGNSLGWAGFDFVAGGSGLLVESAVPGTSAEEAGFGVIPRAILEIDGTPVGTRQEYCDLVGEYTDGDSATLSGVDDFGDRFSVDVAFE